MNDSFEKQQIKSLQNSTVSVFLVQGELEPCNFADQVYEFFDLLLVHFFVFLVAYRQKSMCYRDIENHNITDI